MNFKDYLRQSLNEQLSRRNTGVSHQFGGDSHVMGPGPKPRPTPSPNPYNEMPDSPPPDTSEWTDASDLEDISRETAEWVSYWWGPPATGIFGEDGVLRAVWESASENLQNSVDGWTFL